MTVRVGINGFGRIGRNFWRAVHAGAGAATDIEIVAANDLGDIATMAHLLKYDSLLGTLPEEVSVDGDVIRVGAREIKILAVRDPAELPWGDLGVDVVIESTGRFTKAADAAQAPGRRRPQGDHLRARHRRGHHHRHGRERRRLRRGHATTSSPTPPAPRTAWRRWPRSCTTASASQRGLMTTVHAYTNDQVILDFPHKDLRRARAAAQNIIPTTSGAAKATALVLPELAGKFDGMAMRVPVMDGSITDLVVQLDRDVTKDEVNAAFRAAADGPLKGYLHYTSDPIVSSDIVGTPYSCTFDSLLTMASGDQVKVLGWYDNEWGYSNRIADLTALVGASLPAR